MVVRRATDPELVRGLLLEIARQQSGILANPPPEVFFENIDADTLRFQFVAWIAADRDGSAQIESEFASAVGNRFAERGIDAVVRFASAPPLAEGT